MNRTSDWLKLIVVGIASALIAVGLYAWVGPRSAPRSILEQQRLAPAVRAASSVVVPEGAVDFVAAAQLALPTVVHVKTSADRNSFGRRGQMPGLFDLFRDQPQPERRPTPEEDENPRIQLASGSGVVISTDGYIVTNNHVISSGDQVTVAFDDNKEYTAKIIGTDPTTDIALLKIEAKGLPFLKFGNSDAVKVGQWVLAVGNPFDLTSTVTAGIVSAKARGGLGLIREAAGIESFIQTDAAVNPGNSGGALITTAGELIGINTAIASTNGTYAGYSFAIPANIVTKVVDDLMNYGEVQRGLLGVRIVNVDADANREKDLGTNQGAIITDVNDNSAAADAGLKAGDVIVRVEDQTVSSVSQLQEQIGRRRPGDKVRVGYLRAGKEGTAIVTLKNSAGTTALRKADPASAGNVLGGRLRKLDPKDDAELAKAAGVESGVIVEGLMPGRLRNAGVREGFIITSINDQPVKDPADVDRVIAQRTKDQKTSATLEGYYPGGRNAVYSLLLTPKEAN